MSELTIGLIGTAFGAVLGFLLSEARDRLDRQRRGKWIRELVKTEIQYNLDQLDKVDKKLPTRSVQVWSSQLESMTGVFSEKEFRAVHGFYIGLHNIYKSTDDSRVANSETRGLIDQLVQGGNPIRS